jgi:hypothetical protein
MTDTAIPFYFLAPICYYPRMTRFALAADFAALLACVAVGQPAETHQQRAERFRQMSRDAEAKGLAEPFFLAALASEQRDKTLFTVDDVEWRKWMNQDYTSGRA